MRIENPHLSSFDMPCETWRRAVFTGLWIKNQLVNDFAIWLLQQLYFPNIFCI